MMIDPIRLMGALQQQGEVCYKTMREADSQMLVQANYSAAVVLFSLATAIGNAMADTMKDTTGRLWSANASSGEASESLPQPNSSTSEGSPSSS